MSRASRKKKRIDQIKLELDMPNLDIIAVVNDANERTDSATESIEQYKVMIDELKKELKRKDEMIARLYRRVYKLLKLVKPEQEMIADGILSDGPR